MLIALVSAVLIGLVLGLLGSGGSILPVPVLLYLVHMPDKLAIASSLGIVGGISFVAALPYAWQRLVQWRWMLWFGIPDMAGAWAGAGLAEFLSGKLQLLIFAAVMLTAAIMMLNRRTQEARGQSQHVIWKIVLIGFSVGVLAGVVGVGGGFLIVPALVLLGGLSIRQAIATSLVIIMLAACTGFVRHLLSLSAHGLHPDWRIIGVFILVGAVGSLAGNQFAARLPHTLLRKIFGAFLIAMAAYVVWQTLPRVW